MIYNVIFGTYPSIIHSPGRIAYSPLWNRIANLQTKATVVPKDLTIVTCNSGSASTFVTKNGYKLGSFEKSLNGLPHVILGEGCNNWTNVKKIEILFEFLGEGRTKYTLYVDSADAIMVGDPAVVLEKFKSMQCRMLFNAEKNFWPPEMNELKSFEEGVAKHPFCYLNAGAWIGETEYCKELFALAKLQSPPGRPHSEQARIKPLYPELHPDVKIDDTCEIFQNINRVEDEVILCTTML